MTRGRLTVRSMPFFWLCCWSWSFRRAPARFVIGVGPFTVYWDHAEPTPEES